MTIYLFTAFYRYIPNALMESAVIEGASVLTVFLRIVMPMSKNTIFTILTMNTIFSWNEFVFANTFVNRNEMRTVPLGLYDYVGAKGNIDWGATFSAITIFILPLMLLYFLLSKGVIAGLTAGAVKE